MNISYPDFIISMILAFFTYKGFKNGFIEEIARLSGIIGGLIIASKFHHLLIPLIRSYFESSTLHIPISYICLFILSNIIISLIAKLLQKFIEIILLGWLNRLLGILLGLFKGFIIIGIVIFCIKIIPLNWIDYKKLEENSIMYQICNQVKDLVILTIPIENSLIQNTEQNVLKHLNNLNSD